MAEMTTEQIEQLERTVMSNAGHIRKMDDFVSPEFLYEELIDCVRKYHPSDDISMIKKAFRIANDAHEGQVRKSGEAYIIHPLCVAIILAELELEKVREKLSALEESRSVLSIIWPLEKRKDESL